MQTSNESIPSPPSAPASAFGLTEAAARRVAFLLSDEPPGSYFRVSVQGGGCSGFQYLFDLSNAPLAEDDRLIEQSGARAVVDDTSLELLAGSVLDYTEDMSGAGFAVKNPNATAKCGCGNSFSVGF